MTIWLFIGGGLDRVDSGSYFCSGYWFSFIRVVSCQLKFYCSAVPLSVSSIQYQLSLCRLMMISSDQSCLVLSPCQVVVVTVLSRVWTVDLLTLLAAGQSSAETSLGPYLIFSSATIEWNNINKSERLACHG